MEILCKVGHQFPVDDPNHLRGWLDGQIVDIRPNGFYTNKFARQHFCLIETPHDYWALRGTTDWKSTAPSVYELKKFLVPLGSDGKYEWERTKKIIDTPPRMKDWFVDFKFLQEQKIINKQDYDSIYNPDKDHNKIYIDRDLLFYIFHEDEHTRKAFAPVGSISSGTYSIGSGLNYATVYDFVADISSTLSGNLTGEHNAEETTISSDTVFQSNTNGFLFKLTAQAGDEHNGGAYGNGARVSMGVNDSITIDGANANEVEISNLALNSAGSGNDGIILNNGGNGGLIKVNRVLIVGNGNSDWGMIIQDGAKNVRITNCIIYEFSANDGRGIILNQSSNGNTLEVYNNTVVRCYYNIHQDAASLSNTLVVKNNLAQDPGSADFVDDGGGFGTHGTNVSEDATSPNAAYRSLNCHDGNSCFEDYANDDYRLKAGGDELATLDDGEDLSGIFTDDIQGNTRSLWYIGASELAGAPPTGKPTFAQHYRQMRS